MSQVVTLPPNEPLRADGTKTGGWWHVDEEKDRIVCDLCPRDCHLKPGDRGFCFVRENRGGEMVLSTYGRSTGFCIDPIEKKPLNHFYPGTSVLSFGTAGCNLGCKFCQNWDISKSRKAERLSEEATPESIAEAAQQMGCRSVAYTYNDPVIWAEYAIDVAAACRERGVKSVAVTAGYITPQARKPFFDAMDAANVDLKAFTEDFYQHLTSSHLDPVLETLKWLKDESDVWFEITNLIIPQANDTPDEFQRMCDWVLKNLGDEIPIHFTAFHPDFRMTDRPRTPKETLLAAYDVARQNGIKHVYVGNVNDVEHDSTYCPHCSGLLIERDWHQLGAYHMRGNRCGHCDGVIAGRFENTPGNWGRRRLPVKISNFSRSLPVVTLSTSEPKMSTANPPSEPVVQNVMERPTLTKQQGKLIHQAACRLIAAEVCRHKPELPDPTLGGADNVPVMGAFVTAKRRDQLRGCCGSLGRPMPLMEALRASAARTATQDMRLPPISRTELPYLHIGVTLLYGFTPIASRGTDRIAEVEVGKHGIQIKRGAASGLLLPSVAVENNWTSEQLLDQVCRKAGLPASAWKEDDTQLQTFRGLSIAGSFDTETIPAGDGSHAKVLSDDELEKLCQHVQGNLSALVRGATPNYYVTGVSDGTVAGIAVTWRPPGSDDVQNVSQISMRPGVPLQSTLFTLTETAARAVQAQQLPVAELNQLELGVTVLFDPAMHGTVADPDLDGIDTSRRAIMVIERNKTVWMFDRVATPDELLKLAVREARVDTPETARVFSLGALSTEPSVVVSNRPRPQSGATVRRAAVAGSFYPDDAAELSRLVDKLLDNGSSQQETWPAVMVPHAGLIYSGRIAANVLKRIKIPETVIVIGPKHTRLGVEWAVAPHQTWSLPGGQLESDPSLAQELADTIPGLELDAQAHLREHAIEVELPLLQRLAPSSRVVGIAIGGGDLDRCQQFAKGLADVMRRQQSQPLLVISSDMNHFATDEENRRLDEMALSALDRLDPADVYQTVTGNNISMCGVLPAVMVLETLRELGSLKSSSRVEYGTTADVTGDKSRVVGYAGMLFG